MNSSQIKKNGVLKHSGNNVFSNIGDWIQSIAQEQFYEQVETYVERESLDTIHSDRSINLIMNGWFMYHPECFPPAPCINPLFISFHISPTIAQRLLTPEAVNYLKKYEPIGARDYGTRDILRQCGIQSYFSGCLTLTLGMKFQSPKRGSDVLFVDPYYEFGCGHGHHVKNADVYYSFLYLFLHPFNVLRISSKFIVTRKSNISRFSSRLDKLLWCASFYHSYSKVFDSQLLRNASYITHKCLQIDYKTDDLKMTRARELVSKYASAHLCVTSRLHCALPCLGLETPVIFVEHRSLQKGRYSGRFDGLTDMLHKLEWTMKGFVCKSEQLSIILNHGKINYRSEIINPSDYKHVTKKLIETVSSWIKNNR